MSRIAVVGATGAVGQVMLETLDARGLGAPEHEIVPFASERSAGRVLDNGMTVVALADDTIEGFDLAIFSAGGSVSGEWAPRFAAAGAVVIDNSSRWRMDPEVPLVVAEVNPGALDAHKGIVANPNCSTMQLMVALKPIHAAVGIERLVVSTYQSVSGTGVAAVEELRTQQRAILAGEPVPDPEIYPAVIADNVIGAAGNFPEGDDSTDEERNMMFETRKILGDDSIGISVTCARVPVPYSHSEAVNVQTREPLSAADARALLEGAPGIAVVDDPRTHAHPSARAAAGRDEVFVGRIRDDASHPRALNLWVVSDNLRKGAATNAVQIAELLHERGLIGGRATSVA
ncbi:MAG: Aspartate-semialdehyde dehydrogenase [uncultured Solirubrobacterales bacterium]|uniref:Aspartate-semialdehyde dehydrogenase n=1 Tax=uncultured Solirubrobacterales bacterium TaxID=768556 RepID=A0A6J4SIQ5_9ACTN|nr:MAG: Aspartate-semialdehyde dehydrogenase [uncultured Solirubrobacterales bacterium]